MGKILEWLTSVALQAGTPKSKHKPKKKPKPPKAGQGRHT
jgi:hypothetical protein